MDNFAFRAQTRPAKGEIQAAIAYQTRLTTDRTSTTVAHGPTIENFFDVQPAIAKWHDVHRWPVTP